MSHFTGRSQEVLIRVSNEAWQVGVDGRVEGGEWCGCQGDVKKTSVAKGHTCETLWGSDVLYHSGGQWDGKEEAVPGRVSCLKSVGKMVPTAPGLS